MWTRERVIDHLYYYEEHREFAADYHRTFSPENIKRKRVTRHAPFESPALDNCMFDTCFEHLTMTEQYLLWNLYSKDSGYRIDYDEWNEDAIGKIMEETQMSFYGIKNKVRYAMGCLINELNGIKKEPAEAGKGGKNG